MPRRLSLALGLITAAGVLFADQAQADEVAATLPQINAFDPFQQFNRGVYNFNRGVRKRLPHSKKKGDQPQETHSDNPVVHSIVNFSENLTEPQIFANDILQAHPKRAGVTLARLTINSTAGLAGFFDVANHVGLEYHRADLGQTFGRWGVGAGPFIMLPIIGPYDLRDAVGSIGDSAGDPINGAVGSASNSARIAVSASRAGSKIVYRAVKREKSGHSEESAPDPYIVYRDAYLARRAAFVLESVNVSKALEKPQDSDR